MHESGTKGYWRVFVDMKWKVVSSNFSVNNIRMKCVSFSVDALAKDLEKQIAISVVKMAENPKVSQQILCQCIALAEEYAVKKEAQVFFKILAKCYVLLSIQSKDPDKSLLRDKAFNLDPTDDRFNPKLGSCI